MPQGPRIFISYRREDASFETTAIHRELIDHFGDENVFVDVDSIPLGHDFRQVLADAVEKCDVLLVVIGDAWLEAADDQGRRRLEDAADFVRIEVQAALERDVPVIPLLVGRRPMPRPGDLPFELSGLAYRQGTPIRPGRDFPRDLSLLIEQLERLGGSESSTSTARSPAAYGSRRSMHPPTRGPLEAGRPASHDYSTFISYANEDRGAAEEICAHLEHHGLRCFIAPRDIRPGCSYEEEIVRGIERSKCLILILSERANLSRFVKDQVERAHGKGKSVFPVRIEKVPPSPALDFFISASHWLDVWQGNTAQGMERLARSIAEV